ncbi:PAS domain-containing protein [Haloferax namakaokahaiae]|uniref:histidine kinase n=1 Tax=Haloferax namakaokahaiae TaxID=1748331 RepID=A0ABD5ZEG0_9EURY
MPGTHSGGENNRWDRARQSSDFDILSLLDCTTDSILLLDTDTRVVYANDTALENCRQLGYSGDLVGDIFLDASPLAKESQLVDEISRVLETHESVEFREHYEPLDVWFETRVYPTDDGVVVYSSDISDEVRRGEDLERFEAITKTMQDGVFILDEVGSFVLVNEAFAELVGKEPDALVGELVSVVLDDDVIGRAMDLRQELQHGAIGRFETVVSDQSAVTPVELLVSQSPTNGEYNGTVCVVHDLSSRKQLEAEADATKRERDEALDRVNDSIFSLDEEWRFTYANRVTRQMARLRPGDFGPPMRLLGESIWEVFPHARESELHQRVTRAFETQEVQSLREYIPHLGRSLVSTIYPSENGVTVYARDVSEQVTLEAERDEKNRVLDRVADMVWGVDNDWRFTFANEAAVQFADRPTEEIIGETLWDVFPGASESEFGSMAMEVMETREPGVSLDLAPDYGIWVEARGYPSDSGITFYSRDVSEQVLLETELDEMFDRITDGFYSLDNDWRVVYWSSVMEERTGRSSDEVVGEVIYDVFPEVFKDEMIAEYERAFETQQPITFEIYHEEIDVWNGIALYPSESGLSVYSSNVTERKKREQELEATKTRLELALDGTNTGIWEWDIRSETVLWEGKTNEIFGLEKGEFGETFDDFIELVHPEDVGVLERQIDETMTDSKPYVVEFRFVLPDGEVRWAESRAKIYTDETGEPVRLLGVTSDVTERREREQELEETKTRLELALDGTNTGVWEWDITDDRVIWRGNTSTLFGIESDDFQGGYEDYLERIHPDDVSMVQAEIENAFETSSLYVEHRILLPDGEVRWAEGRGHVYKDESGEPTRMTGIVVNITERKEREHALEESEMRLRSVIENAPLIVFMWDTDGVYTLSEGRGLSQLGLEPGQVVGQSVYDLYADYPDIIELVDRVTAGEELHTFVDVDDLTFEEWFEPVYDDDGTLTHVIGVAVDVTDRVKNERALRESENRLRTVVENAPVVQTVFDADGIVTLSEGQGLELLGREPGDSVGNSMSDLFGDQPEILEQFESALDGEHVHRVFYYMGSHFETWIEPIFDDEGDPTQVITLAVDVSDRLQHEQTLTALHRSSQALLTAETKEGVANVVLDTATDVLGLTPVRVLLFDKQSNTLRPVGRTAADDAEGDTTEYGPDSTYWKQFFGMEECGESEDELCVQIGTHGLFVAGGTDQQADTEDVVELAELLAATAEATLDRVEREASLRDREEILQEQATRLEHLHEINEQLRNIERVLVLSEDRKEIENGICQRFIEPDRFAFAWFGTVENGTVTPTRWAGNERGYLPAIEELSDDTEPATIAAKTHEPVVISSVADRLREEPWRKEALASGYQSMMSVPLVYDGRIYGVLSVYATANDAFDRLSRSVIEDLGRTIAYAINSVETKRGFLTDRVVELALRTKQPQGPLARLAANTGATIRFDGLVHGAEHQRIFFTVTGATAATILAEGDAHPDIESIRVVSEHDDGGTFEMLSSSSMFVTVLADRGAIPRRVESTPDGTLAVVELPHHIDVGGFVQSLQSRYSDVELTARRDRERPPQTKESFAEAYKSTITPRQLEVLETAYFAGYFNSPRTTNGQDVASMLSITQPTFNYHLRAGERTLLRMLIDEGPDASR